MVSLVIDAVLSVEQRIRSVGHGQPAIHRLTGAQPFLVLTRGLLHGVELLSLLPEHVEPRHATALVTALRR